MSADIAVQTAIYNCLISSSEVIALVPAASIADESHRSGPMPSIIVGEGMAMEGNRIDRRDQRVILDLHVWKKEPGLVGVKAIAGAIRHAIGKRRFASATGFHFADCRVTRSRFLRDPDGETAHAVVTVEALGREATR